MTLQWSVRAGPDQAVRRESNPTASAKLRLMTVRRSLFYASGHFKPSPASIASAEDSLEL